MWSDYLYRLEATRYVQIMGRGLGPAQTAILDALALGRRLTISELAEITGRSPRQVRAAVSALRQRGLVHVERTAVGSKPIEGQARVMPVAGLVVSLPPEATP